MSEHRMIPVDQIDPNPWNGHRAADDDLVASVREHGILQNLVVRPIGEERYQLVSGTRRAWAARLAELKEVPCLVCELTDHEARIITVTENLQREDLHPVDEAKGIALLLEDHAVDEVAAKIGKTPAFVTRRAKLISLSENIIANAGEDFLRMSIRALELLATLPEAEQIDIFDGWGGVTLDADDMRRLLAERSGAINGALFDCADETLVPEAGACTNCPKRSGAEPLLFDDLEGSALSKNDCCLDRECYRRKCEAALVRREAELRKRHGEKLRLATGYIPYGEAGANMRKRGVVEICYGHYETCKKKDTGAEPALIIEGKKAGKKVWIRKQKTESTNQTGASKAEAQADPMERKRHKLDQRRHAWIASKLTGMVGGEDDKGNLQLPAEKYRNSEQMVRIAAAFGGGSIISPPGEDYQVGYDDLAVWALAEKAPEEFHWQRIWDSAGDSLRKAMQVYKVSYLDNDFIDALKIVADLVGKPWNELWAEACDAIPEPKSWSRS